jgi:polysaccharide export outer membrane protein
MGTLLMTRLTLRIGIAIGLGLVCGAAQGFAQTATPTSGNKPLPPISTMGSTGTTSTPAPTTPAPTTPASKPSTPAPATPPSAPATSTASAAPAATDYRLAPGDKLRVEVYKDAQLSQSLQIRPDGKVTLPLVGDIVAVDLTPMQLRDRISNSLKEYITNPVVTVIVVEASPVMIHVMGEVATPGSIPMRGPMTVLQALAMAGGFKEFANTKDIRILRRPSGILKTVETISFNYNDAIKGNTPPVFLSPGDMVVVR